MIATTGDIGDFVSVETACYDELWLSIADIVTMAKTSAGPIAPGDNAARSCQSDTVLKPAAELCDSRDRERPQYTVCQQLQE